MEGNEPVASNGVGMEPAGNRLRGEYEQRMQQIQAAFDAGATGVATITARAELLDELVRQLMGR